MQEWRQKTDYICCNHFLCTVHSILAGHNLHDRVHFSLNLIVLRWTNIKEKAFFIISLYRATSIKWGHGGRERLYYITINKIKEQATDCYYFGLNFVQLAIEYQGKKEYFYHHPCHYNLFCNTLVQLLARHHHLFLQ